MRAAALLLLFFLAGSCGQEEKRPAPDDPGRNERIREASSLLDRLEDPEVFGRIVEIGEAAPLVALTRAEGASPRARRLACVALGSIGGDAARDRLLELLGENTKDPARDGPTHLYAAAGLTILQDPGTAIDLVLHLSKVNPNDNIAVLASEERTEEYYTIDAQLCDALLSMGLWQVEEELVEQLRRRDRIRVLIDAHAVLRRQTGLAMPFRYNGSYDDRNADADRWLAKLRETRADRTRKRPFDVENPRFRKRCRDIVAWLGGTAANLQLMARKVFVRVGEPAVPFLVEALRSDNVTAQRQAALLLGRIGSPSGAAALREALSRDDRDVVGKSLDSLRVIGDRQAVPQVPALLRDRDTGVRTAAARYLGEWGDSGHRAALKDSLAAESVSAARTAMLCALLRLGDLDVGREVVGIFVSGQQHERAEALAALQAVTGLWKLATALLPPEEREALAAAMRNWFKEKR